MPNPFRGVSMQTESELELPEPNGRCFLCGDPCEEGRYACNPCWESAQAMAGWIFEPLEEDHA